MQIAIDTRLNRIRIGDQSVVGHGTWEAAALAVLLHYAKGNPGREVTAAMLDQHLAELGKKTPLTRTAWRRLWNGLEVMFVEAECVEAFHQRFVCQPRRRTVGPWRWQAFAEDEVAEQDWPINGSVAPGRPVLHSVAADGTVASTLVVARKLATVHSLWLHGSRFAAINELVTGDEWALAALPIQMHRAVTLADAYTMTDQFDLAREQLRWAIDTAEQNPICRDQRTYAEFILNVIDETAEKGLMSSVYGADKAMINLANSAASGQEIDTRSRAWIFLYMSAGYVNAPQRHVYEGRRYTSTDFISAALCLAIIGWHSDLAASALEYFARNICASSGPIGARELNEFIDSYIAGREWRKVLDIPESFEIGRCWLAWMMVKHAEILVVVEDRIKNGRWLGPHPYTVEFMTETMMRGIDSGDPRLVSRACAAYYKYAKKIGIKENLVMAEETFIGTCKKHPGVVVLLREIGVMSEIPELGKRI